jgi:hypothetical protein
MFWQNLWNWLTLKPSNEKHLPEIIACSHVKSQVSELYMHRPRFGARERIDKDICVSLFLLGKKYDLTEVIELCSIPFWKTGMTDFLDQLEPDDWKDILKHRFQSVISKSLWFNLLHWIKTRPNDEKHILSILSDTLHQFQDTIVEKNCVVSVILGKKLEKEHPVRDSDVPQGSRPTDPFLRDRYGRYERCRLLLSREKKPIATILFEDCSPVPMKAKQIPNLNLMSCEDWKRVACCSNQINGCLLKHLLSLLSWVELDPSRKEDLSNSSIPSADVCCTIDPDTCVIALLAGRKNQQILKKSIEIFSTCPNIPSLNLLGADD